MKILHFIPAAFDYFESIRQQAFTLVDALNELDFQNEIITLQYSAVSKRFEKKVAQETEKRISFEKFYTNKEVEEKMKEVDIIHLHAPFLGFGKKLLKFRKQHPEKKFLITFYGNLPYTDFFTIIIWLYNNYYLKSLMNLADFVVAENEQFFRQNSGFSYLKDLKKFISLDELRSFLLENKEELLEKTNNLKLNKASIHTSLAYGEIYRLLSGK